MNAISPAPSLLDAAGVDPNRAQAILEDALSGADDGELFVERSESESFLFDDGRLKSAAYDATEGFGLRVVAGETAGYAHASEVSEAAIGRAADAAGVGQHAREVDALAACQRDHVAGDGGTHLGERGRGDPAVSEEILERDGVHRIPYRPVHRTGHAKYTKSTEAPG